MYYNRVSLSHVTSNPSLVKTRYIMVVKDSDANGEAWLSLFNEQAERIFGCSADELNKLKSQGEENLFQQKLKEAIWVPHLFRISVAQHEYMNEKRQRITARAVVPVDYAAESKLLLEEISRMKTSQ
ncbi:replication protein A 70 kDa DNA-binding subunit B-like [Vitis riparia]|uniref:replication protein A 70 kDa DNA-binding subunit B-like n=1 Tax=Vitis riparia TaxID=96939 RepID=UPI00155A26A7|nr:replication protein A 70 kDa DNA-binding subunit B-like [Vitis riparia]